MSRGLHVPLDVAYYDDEKMIEAGEKAELLFVRALCFMKQRKSDGFIATTQLPRLHLSGVKQRAERLVSVGLWERTDDGYLCPSWLKHNKSAAEIDYDRNQHAEKMRRLRAKAQGTDVPGHNEPCAEDVPNDVPQPETETRQDKTETRIHLCPDPFVVDDLLREWGRTTTPLVDLDALALNMTDWSRANAKKKADWRRTLQTWARDNQKKLAEEAAKRPVSADDLPW